VWLAEEISHDVVDTTGEKYGDGTRILHAFGDGLATLCGRMLDDLFDLGLIFRVFAEVVDQAAINRQIVRLQVAEQLERVEPQTELFKTQPTANRAQGRMQFLYLLEVSERH